jgi:hypothetical protein
MDDARLKDNLRITELRLHSPLPDSRPHPAPLDPRHRHREARDTPNDTRFIRSFAVAFAGLVFGTAALSLLVDPLGGFGTGLLPPIIAADRDYKTTLYRRLPAPPQVVVIGSSRSKTIRPVCITEITGESAFNFGVNGAVAEDYLAIFRWLEQDPRSAMHLVLLGVDPEAFQESEDPHRALEDSRVLRGLVSGSARQHRWTAVAQDLWSTQAFLAALRSLKYAILGPGEIASTILAADGVEEYPRNEAGLKAGRFPQAERVSESIAGIVPRYANFPRLSPHRLDILKTLIQEADSAHVEIVAFIPPVHPELERATSGGDLPGRSRDLADTLKSLAQAGKLRYIETRELADFGGDSTLYYDALHFMPGNADRLVASLLGRPPCALQ